MTTMTMRFLLLAGFTLSLGSACSQGAQIDGLEERRAPAAIDPPRRAVQPAKPAAPAMPTKAAKPTVAAAPHGEGECACADGSCDGEPEAAPAQVEPGAAPPRGPSNAPVTVVVFSDFECPYCAKAERTMDELEDRYGARVRFAFRNQPLPMHVGARDAARAALAAAKQGKFWEYHDVLFAHQATQDRASLEQYAAQLGLDVARFRAAMDSAEVGAEVDADVAEANRLGVLGTPTFFVNGHRINGAQPVAQFAAAIDGALADRP